MQIKLIASFAFVLLVLILLLLRILAINMVQGNSYAQQVLSQQEYDSRTIPARRGQIEDRNGILLAHSNRVYNVFLDCRAINSREEYLEPTIEALHEVFGLDEATLRERITNEKTRDSLYQVVLSGISDAAKEAFEEYCTLSDEEAAAMDAAERAQAKLELSYIKGVYFEERYVRDYPYDSVASKVIGFSNDIDQGVCGVEAYYDDLLNGTDGREFGYLNDDLDFERTTIDPEHGSTLSLTIDVNIQEIVEKYIEEFDATYGDELHDGQGAENVGVVVMDPNTGEILAMATNSEYDLNNPRDLTDKYSGAEIKAMDDETYVGELAEKWYNFCVSESYEPGSVVKPITVASALEVGAVSDGQHFYCDGGEFITDTQINCDNIYGHGDETLEYAIVNSCNDALMQIGMAMGISNFLQYQSAFNFGQVTGIDLPNENPGVTYDRSGMHEVELATCTFGQGFTVNMVQEAAAFSAVVNGGNYYQPHVVRQVLSADGESLKTVEPLLLRQPVSSQVSSLVRGYLKTAVQEGTGQKSQVPGYLTGGKTGTAEKIDPETGQRDKGKYLVSFIGAAPIDDPQVVIYVVVDEPNVEDQADSSYPQVIFRKIATEVFPYMGLYPTEEVDPLLLQKLGLTEDDIVENNVRSATFQCFDKYGNLYNDAYINANGEVVDGEGNVIEGCTLNLADSTVTDGYGNVISVEITYEIDLASQVADNPDIAAPPQNLSEESGLGSVWSGVTQEDLEEDGEES